MKDQAARRTPGIDLPVPRPFSWRVFLIVWAATVVGMVAVVPYALTLGSSAHRMAGPRLPFPLLLSLQVAASAVLYGALALLGLVLACRIGLGLPFVEGWLGKHPIRGRFLRVAFFSAAVGLIGAAVIVGLDRWVFGPPLRQLLNARGIVAVPPAWQGLLASLEGGISEEVLLRLFALTLLAWLGSLVRRDPEGRPAPVILWLANIVAALLFGLGHLPATASAGLPLNALVVARAIVLNGLPGVAFGWLYWTRGLESAVLSHFTADLMLHVVVPLLA